MRTNTINAQDIWNASTLEESGELLKALSKELFLLKEWHEWASKAEDLRERIISGEEFQNKHSLHTNIELLKHAEIMRNKYEESNKDGITR
tara:strand:+ start:1638 stop:1910 length:273 start_codon:yes stop_codon:yes gene_type:complete